VWRSRTGRTSSELDDGSGFGSGEVPREQSPEGRSDTAEEGQRRAVLPGSGRRWADPARQRRGQRLVALPGSGRRRAIRRSGGGGSTPREGAVAGVRDLVAAFFRLDSIVDPTSKEGTKSSFFLLFPQ
jgi:hypothetical protein